MQKYKWRIFLSQHKKNYKITVLISFLNVDLIDKREGSLILTVHCRTLENLEQLWEDYCSGDLDTVAEECFLTDATTETKGEIGEQSEDDVDTVGLETTILKEEYLRCKKILTELSGKLCKRVWAVKIKLYVELWVHFQKDGL